MLTAFFLAVLPQSTTIAPPTPPVPAVHQVTLTCTVDPIETISITNDAGVQYEAPRVEFGAPALEELFGVAPGSTAVLAGLPLPQSGSLDLALERFSVAATQGSTLFVDGVPALESLTADVALFTGHVVGVEHSDVFLAASDQGTRGWVRFVAANGPRLVHLIAEPDDSGDWSRSTTLVVDDAALGFQPQTTCAVDDLPNRGYLVDQATQGALPPQLDGVPDQLAATSNVLRELSIAVETDYDLFQQFGTLKATKAYAVSLMGAVSARYRSQVNVVITLPYLGIYTNVNDPWTSQDFGLGSIDLLYEFQNSWYANMPVQASLAHFISGAGLGGGVAWLDAMCLPEIQFGVSGNIAGNVPFPISQGPLNWDFVVVAHEIGHNVATPHTHDFCPPIDQCAPNGYFGQCQNTQTCVSNGTLMSYCHLCDGGLQNITTFFHPTVVQTMENRIANSCLPPYEGLLTSNLGGGVIGAGGVPTLAPSWDAQADTLGMAYGMAPAGSNGAIVVSAAKLGMPLFGGTLWPNPDLLLYYQTPTASGSLPPYSFAGFTFPDGFDLVMQSWYVDAQAPAGFSGTDGWNVEVVIPNPPAALVWHRNPSNGKQYALTPAGTWHKGQQLAREHGGELASIGSASLETWLRQTFFDSGLATGAVYIGMTDNVSEGVFQWSNGAAVTYTNWAAGEPNDWQGFEDYASWAGGQWNDLSGYDDLPAIIER